MGDPLTEEHMHARFKLRRYQILAERSQILAAAAQRTIDDLLYLAETQQSAQLAALTDAYRTAIDDVQHGVRVGANLPPRLFQLAAIGRDVAALLMSLQQALIDQTLIVQTLDAPPDDDLAALAAPVGLTGRQP
jgi:hypothetical protein